MNAIIAKQQLIKTRIYKEESLLPYSSAVFNKIKIEIEKAINEGKSSMVINYDRINEFTDKVVDEFESIFQEENLLDENFLQVKNDNTYETVRFQVTDMLNKEFYYIDDYFNSYNPKVKITWNPNKKEARNRLIKISLILICIVLVLFFIFCNHKNNAPNTINNIEISHANNGIPAHPSKQFWYKFYLLNQYTYTSNDLSEKTDEDIKNLALSCGYKDSMLKDGIFTCPDGRTSLDSDFKQ